MAGDPVIGHILDERAADLASGPRAQEGAQDWFVTRLSTHQPSFGPRDPSTRGVLRYSRECVDGEFSEVHIHHPEYPSLRAGAMRHLAAPMDRMLPQDVVGLDRNSLW